MKVRCDKCGDEPDGSPMPEANSPCGRDLSEEVGHEPGTFICKGTYRKTRPTCEACGEHTDDDGDCGYCCNCRLPLCVHNDRYDVNGDGNVCPRACNALSPDGVVCDDEIAHEGQHRWEAS